MKKVLKISLILMLVLCIATTVEAAISCKMNIHTAKSEYEKNEEIVIKMSLSDLQTERGIIVLGGTLNYSKDNFTFIKLNGVNGWNASFNESNGKFLMERSSFINEATDVLEVTLKVKDNSNKNAIILFKEVSISDGNEESKIQDITKTITVKNGDTTPPSGTDNNEVNNNVITNNVINSGKNNVINTNNKVNTITKLPQTGENYMIVYMIIAGIILSVALYIRKIVIENK